MTTTVFRSPLSKRSITNLFGKMQTSLWMHRYREDKSSNVRAMTLQCRSRSGTGTSDEPTAVTSHTDSKLTIASEKPSSTRGRNKKTTHTQRFVRISLTKSWEFSSTVTKIEPTSAVLWKRTSGSCLEPSMITMTESDTSSCRKLKGGTWNGN